MTNALWEASGFMAVVLLGQTAGALPDWTHLASLPFAFAVGAFLIWSMVQLLNSILKSKDSSTETTINALRSQVTSLREDAVLQRKFTDERLTQLIDRDAVALEKNSEAAMASTKAWGEVHEDFRDLITELRVRPCIAKNNQQGA